MSSNKEVTGFLIFKLVAIISLLGDVLQKGYDKPPKIFFL